MSFSAEWLALREPVDLAARDAGLLARATDCAGDGAIVLDLGSGTGSTARAFSADMCATWRWRFLDGDAGLLAKACTLHPNAESVVMNLRDLADLPLDGVRLVTASALLDLMPAAWMSALATRLKQANIPFYAALNYDGVMQWTPAMDSDAAITAAFNAHQQTDKGIGPAMGARSGQMSAKILADHGFDVALGQSPWRLGAAQAAMQAELIAGIANAAAEMGNTDATAWAQSRSDAIATAASVIGHTDIFAVPQAGV